MQTVVKKVARVLYCKKKGCYALGERMNAYDFDDTIFHRNSYRAFYFYCLAHFPWLIIFVFYNLIFVVASWLHLCTKDVMLRECGRFVLLVPNRKKQIKRFWDKKIGRIAEWYKINRRNDDVVISASPRYIVAEACHRLNVKCYASNVDYRNGALVDGHFLYKHEKVNMWKEEFGDVVPENFYTDSRSDLPMLKLAKNGYYVNLNRGTIRLAYQNGEKVDCDEMYVIDKRTKIK